LLFAGESIEHPWRLSQPFCCLWDPKWRDSVQNLAFCLFVTLICIYYEIQCYMIQLLLTSLSSLSSLLYLLWLLWGMDCSCSSTCISETTFVVTRRHDGGENQEGSVRGTLNGSQIWDLQIFAKIRCCFCFKDRGTLRIMITAIYLCAVVCT
jgi:hypothetical protein